MPARPDCRTTDQMPGGKTGRADECRHNRAAVRTPTGSQDREHEQVHGRLSARVPAGACIGKREGMDAHLNAVSIVQMAVCVSGGVPAPVRDRKHDCVQG